MFIQNSQKIKTGIFVILGLVVFLSMIFIIGNQKNLFKRTVTLFINYKTVGGLQEGSYVRFAGINIGTVNLIELKNDTCVTVEIVVQKKMLHFIKKDSKASIVSDGLMGDKLIQISRGELSSSLIAENGTLNSINPFDMNNITSKAEKIGLRIESVINNIDTLSRQLAAIFSKVNNGKGTLGKLINDEKIANDIANTVSSAKKTAKTIDKAAIGLNENMEAAKHNFLLKGYFNKKEKKRKADSIANSKKIKN